MSVPHRLLPTVHSHVGQTALSWLLSHCPNAQDTVSDNIKSLHPSLPLVKKK